MARYRTLKPETFSDEKLAEVSRECRYLFIGLWCFVDDMGRKAYVPKRIQLEVFPADQDLTPKQVDKWIHELARVELIRLYKLDGHDYLWIPHFLRHQRIERPSHSIVPPHPQDPDPDCGCIACKIERGEVNHPVHSRWDKSSPPKFPTHNYSKRPNSRNVPDFTRGVVGEPSGTRGAFPDHSGCSVVEISQIQDQNQIQHQQQNQNQPPSNLDHPLPLSSQENRRTQRSALDEIAIRMLRLLEIKVNSQLLQVVTRSITVKARSKECSHEAAAQQIAARAAFVAAESPPESWEQWFADAAYEYVPQGDERLKDKHIEARPVCGGPRCSEGWEVVKVNNVPVLRRCQDCERLWKDLGL